jgi:AraC-like DNA-binding protein
MGNLTLVEDRYTRFVAERVKSPPLTSGDTLYWDGLGAASQGVGRTPVLEPVAHTAWLAPPLAMDSRASPVVPTQPPGFLSPPAAAIDWAKEAAALSLYLHPGLLIAPVHNIIPGATGELIWVPWQHKTEPFPRTVHPALLVHTASAPLQAECVELVLCLPSDDLIQHHIALVLQAASAAEDVAGQLYAEALVDALVVHFLRRHAASRPARRAAAGGLAPYKLQRTIAYIQAHLEEPLSLTTLADVAQMSPTHFAHLFKHATGLAPHQYVLRCRMGHAKRLLAETDLSLMDIVAQVGCADHSHFTALFRKHVTMTPKAYRNHTRSQFV